MHKKLRPRTVDIITMGCSKNLVDSERLMRRFGDVGFEVRHNPEDVASSVVVINTCGFIGDAKEESIDMVLQCCRAKSEGLVERVYVMGCLSERYKSQLPAEIPEVDGWYGKFDWTGLIADLCDSSDLSADKVDESTRSWERILTTPPYSAFLKVAEGCNRFCAFCAIPLITGRYQSRPIDEIIEETKYLVSKGVKEFNIIAQELSSYGMDIYGRQALAELVDRVADVPGVEWVRLHYLYPAQFPMDVLDVMNRRKNVCRYLDIALQHGSDKVLSAMRRHIDRRSTEELIAEIRRRVPGIHIRTTLMTGFPGEGEAEFEELMDFTSRMRFERMGAFAYCEEEDTYAATHYEDSVPEDVKRERLDRLMALQEGIALECNEAKIGSVVKVLVEKETGDYYVGRTEWDSPEVDPEVLISKEQPLVIGSFVNVIVTDAMPFELYARPLNKNQHEDIQ